MGGTGQVGSHEGGATAEKLKHPSSHALMAQGQEPSNAIAFLLPQDLQRRTPIHRRTPARQGRPVSGWGQWRHGDGSCNLEQAPQAMQRPLALVVALAQSRRPPESMRLCTLVATANGWEHEPQGSGEPGRQPASAAALPGADRHHRPWSAAGRSAGGRLDDGQGSHSPDPLRPVRKHLGAGLSVVYGLVACAALQRP